MNQLYYGDNLDVLRRHIKDESVHLVYLDPPFNSNQDYNVLFKEKDGTDAASQFKAFEDTWEWNQASAEMYEEMRSADKAGLQLAVHAIGDRALGDVLNRHVLPSLRVRKTGRPAR